ncbi:MAG: hypothetical protein QE265_12965 [Rhodoferax sp.]|nr:hypothetical protein [Rhodoferax sp.]
MNPWWTQQAQRINAMRLRERVFLCVTVLVVVWAVADTVWLTPARQAYQQTRSQWQAQTAEISRLRAELAARPAVPDGQAHVQEDLAQAHERMAALRADIAAMTAAARPPGVGLQAAMVQFLKRRPGLRLVQSGTVPPVPGDTGLQPALDSGLRRHSVEITVAGPYAELVRYVHDLEQALPGMRWGPMQLTVEQQTPSLTLRVHWLEVQP